METLEKIINIATQWWNIAMRHYKKLRKDNIETKKHSHDFLTIADTEVNTYVVKELLKNFPQDSIISEEWKAIQWNSPYTWTIDPIDGTKDFINHWTSFSVMIGRYKNGTPTLWVVFAPAKNELYFATQWHWAFIKNWNKNTISQMYVNKTNSLKKSKIVTRHIYWEKREFDKKVYKYLSKRIYTRK